MRLSGAAARMIYARTTLNAPQPPTHLSCQKSNSLVICRATRWIEVFMLIDTEPPSATAAMKNCCAGNTPKQAAVDFSYGFVARLAHRKFSEILCRCCMGWSQIYMKQLGNISTSCCYMWRGWHNDKWCFHVLAKILLPQSIILFFHTPSTFVFLLFAR